MTSAHSANAAAGDAVSLADATSTRRRGIDVVFRVALAFSVGVALITLGALLIDVFLQGRPRLNTELLTNMPSNRPAKAGIQSAIFGSLWCVGITALVSLPIGVGTAVYLEHYARRDRWYVRLTELNIQNLAGVPSVVFGILGLAFIAREPLSWGFTVGTGAMVLTILVLPTVIIASREAIRAVPPSLVDGALALGATRWQAIWRQVLPSALPGIATGSILSVSRALGESAPLLLLGALTFVTFNPTGLDSGYTVLPLLIFKYASDAKAELHVVAAAAIVVLLAMLLLLNSTAIVLRNHFEKRRS
ncbi:phosphate ABC transporter permease PstA [Rhabdothermincola sediminis]|uniref:phosphate ABC transporter permease PstA n=1 Tax=Rhabdothermincola sediminis TaxID=2751370 RepID=UPI001AA024F7|nr:phosphate ABC transporter permease PstA [Rhabdothermincola sediminis]